MEDKEREQKLDQWLDQALSDYNSAEPRFGLEQRVLNRLKAEARPRRWNLWRWMPAFAAIAAAIFVAIAIGPVTMRNHMPQETTPKAATTTRQLEASSQPMSAGLKSDSDKLSSLDSLNSKKSVEVTRAPAHKALVVRQKQSDFAIQVETKSGQNLLAGRRAATAQAAPAPPPPPPPASAVGDGLLNPIPPAPVLGRSYQQLVPMEEQTAASQIDRLSTDREPANGNIDAYEGMHLSPGVAAKLPQPKPKEAHATPPADTSFEAFGVKVRTDKIANAPIGPMQQFPTPAPLSQQERLAVVAGEKLKDKAVTKETNGNIPKIEIKDVEIAPLEAPKK